METSCSLRLIGLAGTEFTASAMPLDKPHCRGTELTNSVRTGWPHATGPHTPCINVRPWSWICCYPAYPGPLFILHRYLSRLIVIRPCCTTNRKLSSLLFWDYSSESRLRLTPPLQRAVRNAFFADGLSRIACCRRYRRRPRPTTRRRRARLVSARAWEHTL